ncbi:MAG: endo-1,4-beta-xylanase [Candidatus Marinimicrobia bacterium]|nr:endo-1,4-beta-xylanase [Candidatus Neomarinimicrobiota bacterium]
MNVQIKPSNIKLTFKLCCFILLILICIACNSSQNPKLKDVYKNAFYIGVALNHDQIFGNDSNSVAIVEEQFNSITPENILKWESVHPGPEKYDFEPADRYVALGEKNHMFIVGHTLVWHHQTPEWVFKDESGSLTDRETLLQRMREHILTVVSRYKGRIHGWDVVNEAITDDGQFRKNKWLEIIGEDYVLKAFEYAHEADPNAELYYNDYNMWKQGQRRGVVRLIRNLQSKGIRVDGVGIQGHWGMDYPPIDELEASILAFSELGVKVMITELDITVLPAAWDYEGADISLNFEMQKELNPYPDALPDTVQNKLANRYAELFLLFHKHSDKISRVTFWGVHDGQSFRNYWPVEGRTDYPLLFDRQYQPKPAFDAVVRTVRNKEYKT